MKGSIEQVRDEAEGEKGEKDEGVERERDEAEEREEDEEREAEEARTSDDPRRLGGRWLTSTSSKPRS